METKLVIEGGRKIKGEVEISGSKNACLPIFAATLLTDEPCRIIGVPGLRDIKTMGEILELLGKKVQTDRNAVTITSTTKRSFIANYEQVKTMRASFCVLGPLLAKAKRAEVSYPGGCAIGDRPVDIHLRGLKELGARIAIDSGYVVAKAHKLKGSYIYLSGHFGSSVTGTANVMMAATLAQGKTVIEGAACEPEVVDLANFLIKMGAHIKGHGTSVIEVNGVKKLHGVDYRVIPDRIEAGTFILAALITKGDIIIRNIDYRHLGVVVDCLRKIGAHIDVGNNKLHVAFKNILKPTNVTTLPYPGFPTDMQAQFASLMCVTPGVSIITEKVFPDRFMHIAELSRMGAHIHREGASAIVEGVKSLSGAPVMASDLRASASLVLAGLAARGKTSISRIYHLERGYENLDKKMIKLGAKIWKEKD
ncbi:MAG: UDP-N-acetylglucosamine 1-carboxyvinyltransferase [Candidatus Omnitrophota bacterium]